MTTVYYRYPGDPILPAILQTGREFLASQPRPREVVVHTYDKTERFDCGDELTCDSCNANIKPDEQTALSIDRLYCPQCLAKWITPYVVMPS